MHKLILLLLYPLAFLLNVSRRGSLTVLTYHRIVEQPDPEDSLSVSKETFERQMEFLSLHYRVLSGEAMADLLLKGESLPKRAVLVTFDDGWADNFDIAYPILLRYGIPAIVFLTTDLIGTNEPFWWEMVESALLLENEAWHRDRNGTVSEPPDEVADRIADILSQPKTERRALIRNLIEFVKLLAPAGHNSIMMWVRRNYAYKRSGSDPTTLSWEQVRVMADGGIAFGSHGKSHILFTTLSSNELSEELRESKTEIERRLGRPVNFVAYPNGNFDARVMAIARAEGYLAGFSCIAGINTDGFSRLAIKRKHVHEQSSLGLTNRYSNVFFEIELSNLRILLKRSVDCLLEAVSRLSDNPTRGRRR